MICPNCSTPIPKDDRKCTKCGARAPKPVEPVKKEDTISKVIIEETAGGFVFLLKKAAENAIVLILIAGAVGGWYYWSSVFKEENVETVRQKETGDNLAKGKASIKNKNYDVALRYFDRAIEITPGGTTAAEAWNGKALAYDGLNLPQESMRCSNEAIKIDSKDPVAWFSKGCALMKLGREEDAVKSLEACMKYDQAKVLTTRCETIIQNVKLKKAKQPKKQ